MKFFISDTFNDGLARLSATEQKAVKTTAFDLQLNPASPGMKFHRIDGAKDPNFWSVRASKDLRIIVHKQGGHFVLCYVSHHDDAYRWAQRRRLEVHPATGAAQLVEIRQKIREIEVPKYVQKESLPEGDAGPQKEKIFRDVPEESLLAYGVPPEWIDEVKDADEDSILEISEHLPSEAAEALLNLAVGKTPETAVPAPHEEPLEHPDARRRFRQVADIDELKQALEYPWEKWAIFLHPVQRKIVEKAFSGPARVTGSAGTGKTIVAVHRAVHLAENNHEATVLLTTFSSPLAKVLEQKLRVLIGNRPRLMEQIQVEALDDVALRLYRVHFGKADFAAEEQIRAFAEDAIQAAGDFPFDVDFVVDEWEKVIDAWQLSSLEQYLDVRRYGRRKRLSEKQRRLLWTVFQKINTALENRGLITWNSVYAGLIDAISDKKLKPFDFAVVDEAQDISVSQLRFLAALGSRRRDSLFFAGDTGQRIFQQPFSWKALGVDIRGRSHILRINYRTSHQIRMCADRLLPEELSDVDGNREDRTGTVSVFNGPEPETVIAGSEDEERDAACRWLENMEASGVMPHETGVFVRSENEIPRACRAIEAAGLKPNVLDEKIEIVRDKVSTGTMHLAKGLEFKAVAVIACDEDVIPLESRIEAAADESELDEIYASERHLLYVACTRARDFLLITGVDPASEFLDDMNGK